jgi:hypothetical protein
MCYLPDLTIFIGCDKENEKEIQILGRMFRFARSQGILQLLLTAHHLVSEKNEPRKYRKIKRSHSRK